MLRYLLALFLSASGIASVSAQTAGQLPANNVWGNPTGARAQARPMSVFNAPFAASATTDTTSAANITSGILPLPRLSGSYTGIVGTGTLLAGATGTGFTVNLGTSTLLGILPVPNGGTGAATFSANLPLIGNGASTLAQGTRSGNTTAFATVSGAMTSGNCVSIDGSGNLVAAGGACTVGGGGGTVAASTIGQVPVYTAATTVTGAPALTYSSGALTVGTANTTLGTVTLDGNTSGAVTIQPQAAAGTWNFNLPTTAGTAGQILTSQGGAAAPMTWTSAGVGTVSAGFINQLAWYAAGGTTVSGLATANNGTLVTSAGGVPSIGSTLPAAVQSNITGLGTITAGVWNGTAITGSNIATNTVANSNLAQMPANTFKCNNTAGTSNVADCTSSGIDQNTLNTQTGNYSIATTDCGKTIQAGTGSTGLFTLTLPVVAGFPTNCVISIKNGDTARGKVLSGFPTDFGGTVGAILWPLQFGQVRILNGAWVTSIDPGPWNTSGGTLNVNHGSGSDTNNDCLGTGAGACATIAHALALMQADIVCGNPKIQLASETFSENVVLLGPPCAGGRSILTFVGDAVTPANVVWQPSGANAQGLTCFDQGWCIVNGITFSGSASSQTALYAGKGGFVGFENVVFGTFTAGFHMQCAVGGVLNYETGTYVVSGSMAYHISCFANGVAIISGAPVVSVPNALTFTDWVGLSSGAAFNTSATYSGTGSGAGSTGAKYNVTINATAVLNGTTLPGATAGSTSTGGQVAP